MKDITNAEMEVALTIVKSPEIIYNANSLAKVIGITSMGCLKILRRLAQESILKSKKIGKAIIYRVNAEDSYARRYVSLLLAREARHANPQAKRWITKAKKIKNADLVILFGSALSKQNPNDIDILLITDRKRVSKLQKEIKELNDLNIKKIHPMYQTFDDIVKNIKKKDKPALNAIKGIVAIGEEKFLEVYNESRKE